METSKPTEHHEKLGKLAGSWTAEETLFPSPWDPNGGTATGRLEARLDLDGFFLVTDYVETRDGRVSYRGHGVYGYDPKTATYTMHWFDSMGGGGYGAPARGRWEGDVLTFENETPMGRSRYVYRLEGEGRYTFRIESSRDGATWTPFMEGRFRRS